MKEAFEGSTWENHVHHCGFHARLSIFPSVLFDYRRFHTLGSLATDFVNVCTYVCASVAPISI